jgi:hypothetical protein
LHNLQISQTVFTTPAGIVGWLGAAQAQDFAGAKWSLGLRLRPTSDAAIEQAFNQGLILRTHVMRPTWHFVLPEDIRWLQALSAPRVHAVNGSMNRQLELDTPLLTRCADAIRRALEGGRQLTRDELKAELERAGISVVGGKDRSGQRLAYIVMWAELEALICSGPRRGKQFTYMLLDERAPEARTMPRDEALAELLRRYFRSHGPATAEDFARWSGLTLSDTRQGVEAVANEFHSEQVEGQTYWFANDTLPAREPLPKAYVFSIYDEYTIGYKDRSAIGEREHGPILQAMGNALQNVIVLDGRIVGTWRREIGKNTVAIEFTLLRPLAGAEKAAVDAAAGEYGEFLGLQMDVRF